MWSGGQALAPILPQLPQDQALSEAGSESTGPGLAERLCCREVWGVWACGRGVGLHGEPCCSGPWAVMLKPSAHGSSPDSCLSPAQARGTQVCLLSQPGKQRAGEILKERMGVRLESPWPPQIPSRRNRAGLRELRGCPRAGGRGHPKPEPQGAGGWGGGHRQAAEPSQGTGMLRASPSTVPISVDY